MDADDAETGTSHLERWSWVLLALLLAGHALGCVFCLPAALLFGLALVALDWAHSGDFWWRPCQRRLLFLGIAAVAYLAALPIFHGLLAIVALVFATGFAFSQQLDALRRRLDKYDSNRAGSRTTTTSGARRGSS